MEAFYMAGYTIEDIDIIRKKSGISYQEAIALLEYHNGNLAQALIDLERNGKIRKEEPEEKKKSKFSGILHTVYCMRLKIRKDDVTIINFSVLFCLVCAVFAPYLTIAGCVIALILGYRFAFIKHDSSFDQEDLESKFQHAASNVRSSLGDMAKGFADASHAEEKKPEKENTSYYQHRDASRRAQVPEIRVPKRVDSPDGSVHFEEDSDGYSNATIE